MVKMYIGVNVNYPLLLSNFHKTWNFLDRFSFNTQISKFHKNPSSGNRIFPYGRTDGQKGMTKLKNLRTRLKTNQLMIPKVQVTLCSEIPTNHKPM